MLQFPKRDYPSLDYALKLTSRARLQRRLLLTFREGKLGKGLSGIGYQNIVTSVGMWGTPRIHVMQMAKRRSRLREITPGLKTDGNIQTIQKWAEESKQDNLGVTGVNQPMGDDTISDAEIGAGSKGMAGVDSGALTSGAAPDVGSVGEGVEEGFQLVGNKKGKFGGYRGRGGGRSLSFDRGRGGGRGFVSRDLEELSAGYVEKMYGMPASQSFKLGEEASLSNPKFFKSLPNGDFDAEQYEDEKDWEPDEEQEEESSLEAGLLLEKRGECEGASRSQREEGHQKKGRFETSVSLQIC